MIITNAFVIKKNKTNKLYANTTTNSMIINQTDVELAHNLKKRYNKKFLEHSN